MPAKVKRARLPWIAEAECENGTRVKIHERDEQRGFIHGYLSNHNSMPQCWSIDGKIISDYLTDRYNLVMETYKEAQQ